MEGLDTFDFSAPPKPKQEGLDTSGFDSFDFSAPMTQKAPQEEGGPGLLERTAPQLKERNLRMKEDISNLIKADIPPQGVTPVLAELSRTGLNLAGEFGGSVMDVMGEVLVSAGRVAASLTPDFIKEPVSENASKAFQSIVTSDIGKEGLVAMEQGVGAYREWRSNNPKEGRLIENFVNIGVVFAPVKTKANAGPSKLTVMSDKAKAAANAQIAGDRNKFMQGLVGPVRDVRTLKQEVPRTTEIGSGPFKRNIVEASPIEKEMAAEVAKIKGVSPKNSIQKNYSVIQETNKGLAVKLQSDVTKANVSIPQQNILQELDDVIDEAITNNMYIVGTGENAAEKLRSNVGKIILKHENKSGFIKGEDLLKARQELDQVIKDQKPSVFKEGTAESSIEIMAKATRNAMNDILDRNVTGSRAIDLKVKEELKRQSLLFRTMDNLVPKAAAEGNNAIIRALQNSMKATHLRNEVVQLLALSAGVGGLGAAAFAAPIVRDVGVVATASYAAYKGARSAGLKKLMSGTLNVVDGAIRTTENPSMLKALRADRALIVEMLENTVGHGEANKPIPLDPGLEER